MIVLQQLLMLKLMIALNQSHITFMLLQKGHRSGINKASVENAIKQLVEQGLLVRHGTGRSTFYTRGDAQ